MAKKTRRKAKPKIESPQLKGLKTRVRNLESKLSGSVPRGEVEVLKGSLGAKVSELQAQLERSVPRSEADSLRARAAELELRLAESVPKARLDEAGRRVNELEARGRTIEARNGELESRERDLRSKIQDLQLGESSHAREVEALKERITEAERNLAGCAAELEAARARAKQVESASSKPSAAGGGTETPVQ